LWLKKTTGGNFKNMHKTVMGKPLHYRRKPNKKGKIVMGKPFLITVENATKWRKF